MGERLSHRYDWRQWKENAPDVLRIDGAKAVESWCRSMAEECRQQDIREFVQAALSKNSDPPDP